MIPDIKILPRETRDFLTQKTKAKVTRKSVIKSGIMTGQTREYDSSYSDAWKYFFTGSQIKEIRKVCGSFYEEVPFQWA